MVLHERLREVLERMRQVSNLEDQLTVLVSVVPVRSLLRHEFFR